ncbi:MAG: hypothetical protein WAW41_09780, partial [Methylobacter sp.]
AGRGGVHGGEVDDSIGDPPDAPVCSDHFVVGRHGQEERVAPRGLSDVEAGATFFPIYHLEHVFPRPARDHPEQFPAMRFILDKSHLKKHLHDTAVALGFNQQEQRKWVQSKLDAISEGRVQEILEELANRNATEPNDCLHRFIAYLQRLEDAVDYDRFKALGYPIGSGEMESAHRSIPQKRLKLPGASWHPSSINPILALRVITANDWWSDYWEYEIAATNKTA